MMIRIVHNTNAHVALNNYACNREWMKSNCVFITTPTRLCKSVTRGCIRFCYYNVIAIIISQIVIFK